MSSATPDWQRALSLFDEALALPPDQREAWLDDTAAREPGVSPLLRKLLGAHRRVETNDVLATLPRRPDALRDEPAGTCGQLIGPFELIEPIGHGGMGSVWRARYADGRLKRDVAIKLPAATQNPTALATMRERFARERDFLAQLEHPNIARLYDTGVSETGQPFLAMEYVAGEPIDAYCEHHRKPFNGRLKLFLQVLDAVDYAHRQLVLHRDLKPGNVLVDANGNVRLLDFGVAKLLPELNAAQPDANANKELTEIAGTAMTLAYAAPEQITGAPLSTATDVYALGVMLHRLLTGASPYQPARDSRGALEDEVINNAPALASSRHATDATLAALQSTAPALRRALTGDVDTILTKSLKKRPDERYPTAASLAEDIRRHLARQPISARPDSLWYRTNRLVARHRVAVVASALGVTALIATTGIAVWQANVATASAARAEKASASAAAAQKFFAGLFASADPEQNKSITALDRQMLDRAFATARTQFGNEPETLLLILKEIAGIYARLDQPEKMFEVSQARVELARARPDIELKLLADAEIEYATAWRDHPRPDIRAQALPHAEHALAVARQSGDVTQIVNALHTVATVLRLARRLPEALAISNEAINVGREQLGDQAWLVGIAYSERGQILRALRRLPEAIDDLKFATTSAKLAKEPNAVFHFVNTSTALALALYDHARYAESASTAIDTVTFARNALGESADLLTPLKNTAIGAALQAGDVTTAERLGQDYLADELRSVDPFRAARARYAMAQIAHGKGEDVQALALLDAALPDMAQQPRWVARAKSYRGMVRLSLGANAVPTQLAHNELLEVANSLRAQQLSESVDFSVNAARLAVSFARLGELDAARTALDEGCRATERDGESRHPGQVRCKAYRLLMLSAQSDASQLVELAQTFRASRADDSPLHRQLEDAIAWLRDPVSNATKTTRFPLLN